MPAATLRGRGQVGAMSDPRYPDAKSPTSFQDGLEFQDFVCAELAKRGIVLQNLGSKKYQLDVGENLQGFEIKLDNLCTRTGRLSIEIAEKSRDDPMLDWTDSGIMRKDNSWLYIQGNRSILFIFSKKFLRRWMNIKKPKIEECRGTIRKFYISLKDAKKFAERVIEFNDSNGRSAA